MGELSAREKSVNKSKVEMICCSGLLDQGIFANRMKTQKSLESREEYKVWKRNHH
jgi:hypothetical protein